jgi:hypothetical protein
MEQFNNFSPLRNNNVKGISGMSFYRMSDAPPDWAQEDASQPDYIANKDLAEKLRRIFVNGVEMLDDSHESGALNFVAGDNISLTVEGNSIIITASGTGSGTDLEAVKAIVKQETDRATAAENEISNNLISLAEITRENFSQTNDKIQLISSSVLKIEEKIDTGDKTVSSYVEDRLAIGQETVASYVAKEIEKVNTFGAPIATEETYGLVKLSKQIGIDEEGGLRIKQITTDDIVQGESMWVLNGGDESVIPN